MLVGCLAVALHGVECNTMDIDVCVEVSRTNVAHLIAAAQDLQLQPVLPVPLSALADIDTLHHWHAERHLTAFALRSDRPAGVTLDLLTYPLRSNPVVPRPICLMSILSHI